MYFAQVETEGLVLEAAHSGFNLMPVTLDNMRPDEVLVEMKYSGICHTDLAGSLGRYRALDYPAVLGHEGAGIVRAIGPNIENCSLKIGQSVILSFNHCGKCINCIASHPACCTRFETLNISGRRLNDGGTPAKLADGRRVVSQFFGQSSFLRLSIVSQHSVVPCPYPEDLATYAALGCGFQTGAGTVLNALKPSAHESLLIIGAGTVGVAAVMAARYLGLGQIIVVDILDDKLRLARDLGATHSINSSKSPDIVQEVYSLTKGGACYTLECTGATSVIDMILDCTRCGGTAAIIGTPKPDFIMRVDPVRLLHENKTLRGICQGDSIPTEFLPEMMELHRAGHFPLEKLCSFYSINDFEKAITDVREGKVLKPILKW